MTMLESVKAWFGGTSVQPERRGAPRIEAPTSSTVTIKGRAHPLKNWSATGFLASPYDGEVTEKEPLSVHIEIQQDHESFGIDARAIAVRHDSAGLAATFTSMSTKDRQRLDAHFDCYGLWRRLNGLSRA